MDKRLCIKYAKPFIINRDIMKICKPENYLRIDKYVSRSAQIKEENIPWLKRDGITDVINFRTMIDPAIDFDEGKALAQNKITYHNIPSVTNSPTDENVAKFLDIIEGVKHKNGKVHIHCKKGADRTGMYSFIYERVNNVKDIYKSVSEFFKQGYHYDRYPDLMYLAELFVKKLKK